MSKHHGAGADRGPGPRRLRRRPVPKRWWIAGAAGSAALCLTAGVAYAVTGTSDDPAGSRPVADRAASTPSAASSPAAPAQSTTPRRAPSKDPRRATAAKKKPTAKPKAPKKRTTPKPSTGTGSGGQSTTPTGGGTAGQVIALTNAERAKHGCGPLTLDAKLQSAAQAHSADMVARNFFDHTNPSGKDPGDRITAAGYRWSTYGENIAAGQQTPASVMSSWMNSPGHRANILNCKFKNIGVGVAKKGNSPYWTQDFGTRL
ncbi:CAP domain-containing protein [Actinomadura fibrosa]|uniref:CAP domain-containing protein n=1 Tax=Actinomadura fibrosa TaxID=111802 RepID=A0ABW2XPC3_9ACTN|nr:CAP domain-containing protein [Actinomadura fibrosa]